MAKQTVEDSGKWLKNTFTVTLGPSLKTFMQVLDTANRVNDWANGGALQPDQQATRRVISDYILQDDTANGVKVFMTKGRCRDTSLGGNDAINPFFQFGKNDDIIHPLTAIRSDPDLGGEGRVYSEMIEDHQQIMYITFGVIQYNNMQGFLSGSIIDDIAKLMSTGDEWSLSTISYLTGKTIGTFIRLPFMPLSWINGLLNRLGNTPITKYFEFKTTMPLYYRMVNTIIVHLSVNLGLASTPIVDFYQDARSVSDKYKYMSEAERQRIYMASAVEDGIDNPLSQQNYVGIPEPFRSLGFDIYKILLRKYQFDNENFDITKMKDTDTVLNELIGKSKQKTLNNPNMPDDMLVVDNVGPMVGQDPNSLVEKFSYGEYSPASGPSTGVYQDYTYRVKTGENTYEVISPSDVAGTGMTSYQVAENLAKNATASQIAVSKSDLTDEERVQQTSQLKRYEKNFWTQFADTYELAMYDSQMYIGFKIDKSFDTSESVSNQLGEGSVAGIINGITQNARNAEFSTMGGQLLDSSLINDTFSAINNMAKGILDGVTGGLSSVIFGKGIVDIPEMWQGSSFSKSYSFNIPLRSVYGDVWSIMTSNYIPLAALLAGALPRGVGPTSYTNPFYCRAYCKGMFAIPCGMIDSITIKRGSEMFGWNPNRLPTALDISFSIRDLHPAMYALMADKLLDWPLGENSTFQEYLLTLSGMGLAERSHRVLNKAKRGDIALKILNDNKLSPSNIALSVADTPVGKLMNVLTAGTRVPNT